MASRKLSLAKESLTDMTPDELRSVAAADGYTGNTRCWLSIDPCISLGSCNGLCIGPTS